MRRGHLQTDFDSDVVVDLEELLEVHVHSEQM